MYWTRSVEFIVDMTAERNTRLKCTRLFSSQIELNATKLHSSPQCKWIMQKANPRIYQGKVMQYSSVVRYQPSRTCFSVTEYKLKAKSSTNNLKALQSISWEEKQHSVMPMGSSDVRQIFTTKDLLFFSFSSNSVCNYQQTDFVFVVAYRQKFTIVYPPHTVSSQAKLILR